MEGYGAGALPECGPGAGASCVEEWHGRGAVHYAHYQQCQDSWLMLPGFYLLPPWFLGGASPRPAAPRRAPPLPPAPPPAPRRAPRRAVDRGGIPPGKAAKAKAGGGPPGRWRPKGKDLEPPPGRGTRETLKPVQPQPPGGGNGGGRQRPAHAARQRRGG